MFIKLDQVPVIPRRLRHCLVGVVESGLAEGVAVPFEAGYFTRFAADACRGVHEFANLKLAVQPSARDGSGMPRDPNYFCRGLAHRCSLRLLNLYKETLGFRSVRIRIGHRGSE